MHPSISSPVPKPRCFLPFRFPGSSFPLVKTNAVVQCYNPFSFLTSVWWCHLATRFSLRFFVITFNSKGQNPFDLLVNLPEEGFVSTFCRQMGHIFLVASMCREECRHSEQKRWPQCVTVRSVQSSMQMTHWKLPNFTTLSSFGGAGTGGAGGGTASSEPRRSIISSPPFLSSSESSNSSISSSSACSFFRPCCFLVVLVRLALDDCWAGWDVEEEEVSCRETRRCFLAGRASGAGEGLPKRSSESGITISGMGSWRERFLEDRVEDSEGMLRSRSRWRCV